MSTNAADFRQAAQQWTARRAEVEGDAQALAQWRRESLATWRTAIVATHAAEDLGRIHAALGDVNVRDAAALLTIFPDLANVFDADETTAKDRIGKAFNQVFADATVTPNTVEVDAAIRVLVEVGKHAPSAPVYATLALLAWWIDDTHRASSWARMALDADETHSLARLLWMTVTSCLRPAWARSVAA